MPEWSKLLKSFIQYHVVHYEWIIEVRFYLVEPYLGILLDLKPQSTHLMLQTIFLNLCRPINNPIEGLCFSSLEYHAFPALSNWFFRENKKDWLASCFKHIKQYQANKLENALQVLMKHLAAILSRQQGVQYEFGPEFVESHAKKLAGLQKTCTFVLSLKFFIEEQLSEICVENK